ncbi:chaperone protein [Colletotrichum graminicola]|nr:chaperone protein [Colletotrichum graminicola]
MQQPSTADHYGDLGIQQSATLSQIRQAYRKQALKYHPDKNAPGEMINAEDFRRVQEAWEVLRDEFKRAEYDQVYADIHRAWEKSVGSFEIRRPARERERLIRAKAIFLLFLLLSSYLTPGRFE